MGAVHGGPHPQALKSRDRTAAESGIREFIERITLFQRFTQFGLGDEVGQPRILHLTIRLRESCLRSSTSLSNRRFHLELVEDDTQTLTGRCLLRLRRSLLIACQVFPSQLVVDVYLRRRLRLLIGQARLLDALVFSTISCLRLPQSKGSFQVRRKPAVRV